MTNKNLINVIVRLAQGSITRITDVTDEGYKVAAMRKPIPANELVRKGRVLVHIDPKTLTYPKEQMVMLDEGYLHIHTRDAMRRIKKGETVALPPAFTDFSRDDGALPKPKVPAKAAPKTIAKPKANVKAAPKPAKPEVKAEVKTAKKTKATTKAKPVVRSAPIDRDTETAHTLFLVVQHARSNNKAWKEFKTVLAKSIYAGSVVGDISEIPNTSHEIIAKFGAARVRKGLAALSAHFNRRNAELSLPRNLRAFLKDGKMALNKTQIRAVVSALAPNIRPEVLDDVVDIYFGGEFTLNKVPVRGKKTEGVK